MVRQLLEVVVGLLRFNGGWDECVEGLVRQGNRLVHAVHGARGVQDDGVVTRLALAVGDGAAIVFLQEVLHHEPVGKVAEHGRVRIAENLEQGNGELAAHGAFQHDDAAQPERFLFADQALHLQRKRPHFRDDQVGDSLPLEHVAALLLVVEVERVDDRHRGARHVHAVEREDRLRRRRADEHDPGVVLARDADARKRFRIPLPFAEQLAVGVRPVSIAHGYAVQSLVAEGVHLLDERPAGLIQHIPVFELLDQSFPLRALFHNRG